MKPLFARDSLIFLESLSFTKTLYAFDFDGTLSKIVREPSMAVVSAKTAELLRALSDLAPLAVVSGRGLADLSQRVQFNPRYLVGNHGLEGLKGSPKALENARRESCQWKAALEKIRWSPGIEIEDKIYSLSIHYRRSRRKSVAKEQIKEAIGNLSPVPRVISGKSVFNVLPHGAPHKGLSVLELARHAGARHVFYIGDDDTDEDVFSLPDPAVTSVRVGRKTTSHARYFIERQSDINRLLKLLISFHQKPLKMESKEETRLGRTR